MAFYGGLLSLGYKFACDCNVYIIPKREDMETQRIYDKMDPFKAGDAFHWRKGKQSAYYDRIDTEPEWKKWEKKEQEQE